MAAWGLFKVNSANFPEIAVLLTKPKVQSLARESQAQNASTPRNRSGRNVFFPEEFNTGSASSTSGTQRSRPALREVASVVVNPLPEA